MSGISFDSTYVVIAQRAAVANYIAEDPERVAIIEVQTVVGSEPHKAIVILVDARHGVV
jgi:hypothetical protein